jgi:nucleotide-binding universal stress UspA family protein
MPLTINKILIPIDFSENSKQALRYANSFGTMFSSELILVYVIEPVLYPPDFSLGQITVSTPGLQEIDSRAREELSRLAEEERALGLTVKSLVRTGKPFVEIIQCAKDEDVDLIIISSHGHSGMEHILFGSTSEKVVRKAPCPVLTLREPVKGFDYQEALNKD